MGRDAVRLHRTQARSKCHGRRTCRLVQEKSRRLQGAAHHRVRGIAEDQYRQGTEIQIKGSGQSLMIVTSHSDNVLSGTSGGWRVWSLSDGYIEMPADLLRDPQNNPAPQAAQAGALRLSVNCFALAGPGV